MKVRTTRICYTKTMCPVEDALFRQAGVEVFASASGIRLRKWDGKRYRVPERVKRFMRRVDRGVATRGESVSFDWPLPLREGQTSASEVLPPREPTKEVRR